MPEGGGGGGGGGILSALHGHLESPHWHLESPLSLALFKKNLKIFNNMSCVHDILKC